MLPEISDAPSAEDQHGAGMMSSVAMPEIDADGWHERPYPDDGDDARMDALEQAEQVCGCIGPIDEPRPAA
jgi:hypothetical protein